MLKRPFQLMALLASLLPAQNPPKSNPAPNSPPIHSTSDTSAPEQITLLRPRIESLENEVASLKTASRDSTAQIALLRSRLQSLEKEAASLKSISRAHAELIVSTGSEVFRLKHFSAEFDPAEPGKLSGSASILTPGLFWFPSRESNRTWTGANYASMLETRIALPFAASM